MNNTNEKKVNKKYLILLMAGIVSFTVLVLVVIYMKQVTFYRTHFLPNTTVNGMNCSKLDAVTVAGMLEKQEESYTITLMGRDEKGTTIELGEIRGTDINRSIVDVKKDVETLLKEQDANAWLLANNKTTSYHLVPGITFDEDALEKEVKTLQAFSIDTMIAPEDAYIGDYSKEMGSYEVVPEVYGTMLSVEHAIEAMKAAIYGGANTIDFVEQGCYENPTILASDKKLSSTVEKMNQWLGSEINYDWNGNEVVVNHEVIKDWITLENGEPQLEEEAIKAFVTTNAKNFDTYGKTHKFTTTLGVEVSLPTGKFGWKTDKESETKELLALVEKGSKTTREPIYSHTAPRKGSNDIGNSYVEADLSNQHLYLYNKGELVFETDFVSGTFSSTPDCITPQGVFGLTYKTKNAVLRGDTYETPVSYWMPFYGNYGMHDATWRSSFGGDIFLTNGSHGCINLPLDSAAVIYGYMYEGYPVICYYY